MSSSAFIVGWPWTIASSDLKQLCCRLPGGLIRLAIQLIRGSDGIVSSDRVLSFEGQLFDVGEADCSECLQSIMGWYNLNNSFASNGSNYQFIQVSMKSDLFRTSPPVPLKHPAPQAIKVLVSPPTASPEASERSGLLLSLRLLLQ